jgi:hypothetical protein
LIGLQVALRSIGKATLGTIGTKIVMERLIEVGIGVNIQRDSSGVVVGKMGKVKDAEPLHMKHELVGVEGEREKA